MGRVRQTNDRDRPGVVPMTAPPTDRAAVRTKWAARLVRVDSHLTQAYVSRDLASPARRDRSSQPDRRWRVPRSESGETPSSPAYGSTSILPSPTSVPRITMPFVNSPIATSRSRSVLGTTSTQSASPNTNSVFVTTPRRHQLRGPANRPPRSEGGRRSRSRRRSLSHGPSRCEHERSTSPPRPHDGGAQHGGRSARLEGVSPIPLPVAKEQALKLIELAERPG